MKHPERIEDYLEHILEAIARATSYLEDTRDFATFQRDKRSQDAIVRNIGIIGEAASKIQNSAPEFIASHPEVPWARLRGIRNVVIHEYFSADLESVWETVRDDLPELKHLIGALLASRCSGNPEL